MPHNHGRPTVTGLDLFILAATSVIVLAATGLLAIHSNKGGSSPSPRDIKDAIHQSRALLPVRSHKAIRYDRS